MIFRLSKKLIITPSKLIIHSKFVAPSFGSRTILSVLPMILSIAKIEFTGDNDTEEDSVPLGAIKCLLVLLIEIKKS